MRKLIYVLVGMAVLGALGLLAHQRQRQPATLEGLYGRYHQRGQQAGIGSPFSGAVFVARGGEVVFRQAYGFADLEREESLAIDSRFLVGSSAKPLTAVLVLQQVENGVLDLDGVVSDYLAEFPTDPGVRITIHQLLSHTAGLPRDAVEWSGLTLRHEPGSAFAFSNMGYEVLVSILESATGQGYAALLEAGITGPLGLANTGFASGQALADATASGLSYHEHSFPVSIFVPGDGSYEEMRRPEAGAVYSTVEDLYRIVTALHAAELLSETTTETMLTPTRQGSAYGWFRNRRELFSRNPDAALYSHEGRFGGHNALVASYDDGTTAIVLSNVDPLDTAELLTSTYLAAHGTNEVTTDLKHPSLSNPRAFAQDGGPDAFLAYYEKLSEKAGYTIPPSGDFCGQVVQLLIRDEAYADAAEFAGHAFEQWPPMSPGTLNGIGYVFMGRDRPDEARRFFNRNVELFPEVANGYDSLGELEEREGNLELAHELYSRALQLALDNDDRLIGFYRRRISDLEKTMPQTPNP